MPTTQKTTAAARIDVVSTIEAATPTVTVTKDLAVRSVGQGDTVTFTAAGEVTGEGAGTLSYEWFVDDTSVGTGETYTFEADKLGDVQIYCIVTNTFENVKTATARSKTVKLTVIGKEIATADEMLAFAETVNNGNSYKGKTVTLTADIDLSRTEWKPIGSDSDTRFEGTFDGYCFQGTFVNYSSGNPLRFNVVEQ